MKLLLFGLVILGLAFIVSACAFFDSPQERQGVNPKPFNAPATWEMPARSIN